MIGLWFLRQRSWKRRAWLALKGPLGWFRYRLPSLAGNWERQHGSEHASTALTVLAESLVRKNNKLAPEYKLANNGHISRK
jgi:hypothetical protein